MVRIGMYTRSHSGATRCCCKCKEPNWSCSFCGKIFSRKWNAERHIVNIHSGKAGLLTYSEYQAGVTSGRLTLSAKSRRGFTFGAKSAQAKVLLDKRSYEELERVLGIKRILKESFVGIRGRVCENCMSIVYEGNIVNIVIGKLPLYGHTCSCGWLFD